MLDFTEIKKILLRIYSSKSSQKTGSLFQSYITKSSTKTLAIIRMLSLEENQLLRELGNFVQQVLPEEYEKILVVKGFKKYEIQAILSDVLSPINF